jgi:alpha-glucan,water dikinase
MSKQVQTSEKCPLGEGLFVAQLPDNDGVTLLLETQNDTDCVLHWGLSRRPGGPWYRPPDTCWPEGTTPVDGHAVRTPLSVLDKGQRGVKIHLDSPCPWRNLAFVLHFPRENRWLKAGGRDFLIPLPEDHAVPSPEVALAAWMPDATTARQAVVLDTGERLAFATHVTAEAVRVGLVCDAVGTLKLHWGLSWQFRSQWQLPPENYRPAGTTVFDQQAIETAFTQRDGLQYLELNFPKPSGGSGPRGLRFVLVQPEYNTWLKSGGKDLYVPLFEAQRDPRLPSAKLSDLAEQIVGAEMGAPSWTLMHRFNLCHDLLGQVEDDEDGLALLFAWLRYSAIRQLDWQRCYNTKPRELSAAQDRLTARLAALWRRHHRPGATSGAQSGCRQWARLMLTTLGRGGEGQQVRDEILHIMHRNGLRETAGCFVEEWHQKLHNNTTPDDVVICEAYLAFLRSNGDGKQFDDVLKAGGVTRERLLSFERPIKTAPEFYGDRKDALIGEFENFLRILKSVHAGTDLESAVGAARGRLDPGMNQQLDAILGLRGTRTPVRQLLRAVTAAREKLASMMAATREDPALRDLLFLDLALEQCQRGAIERQNLSQLRRDELVDLVTEVLRSLPFSVDSPELSACAGHWAALVSRPRDGKDWALHARSVTDRAARWVQGFTSDVYQHLQPKAEFLGNAFRAEAWTVPLFSEEVIRGGPAFGLALLLRHLDPILRKQAGLGGWQVISPAQAAGRLRVVERLIDVQTERFAEPTVLIADHVGGEEEVPEGVTAVLTCDTPDLVSHLAVRARNSQVLFATCFEPKEYQRLKDLANRTVSLNVTPGGDVAYQEGTVARKEDASAGLAERRPLSSAGRPTFTRWVVTQNEFAPGIVGGKSNNLTGLRGRLPDWIHLPASLALPFGVLEKVLEDERNRKLWGECQAFIAAAEQKPTEALAQLRQRLLQLTTPTELQMSLLQAWQRTGLPEVAWEQVWPTVCRVWASKWNERAYLSRRARGVAHDSLAMAVLIQQVVPADYAFVIHTVNPLTGNRREVFAEVVLGLGETLVGNYPGRALGFVCSRGDLKPVILSYPSKSVGLYGKGVIFRSDSNGEDLEGFAGAGLYDSFLAEEPQRRLLDYRTEKLVWDTGFRDDLLRSIARIGLEVERVLGSPQDIEGAVTGGKFYVVQTRPQVGLDGQS